ncbi:SDR family oxidoreductase [Pseudovibrio sp. Tun.PSC04-5.I4]|uniref:SDR family NAD(P)-dependent oxidoreductase n=1 Tax=Pseudovibrio sp. Tun.PSC04-5.I4 TaxID=1798213 RepID=UPI000888653B|nr:SDR family oxidoreductase [Pseudovibrio sp. Tun.PSC04-5.I4]SDQ76916.1 hypothetical protein SAMN04515695_1327 [Pseudovibrio sp. Tun.PSC04-5.I4]
MSSYRFQGRTAVITGGGGDIAGHIAKRLHNRGMNLVLADINGRAARELQSQLDGLKVHVFEGDLTRRDEMQRLLRETEENFGILDVLINNMAITKVARFHERSPESIEDEITINLLSPLILTRLAVPFLLKGDDPRVITTTSLGGIQPLRETPIYAATKFGLRGAMLSFGLDEDLHGIKVSCVLPTATDTYMLRQEAIENGSVLNFIDEPQSPAVVADQFVKHLENPCLERYPKASDSWLTRLAMLLPNQMPRILPFFEKKGRRGMAKYIASLRQRGLLIEVDGKLYQRQRLYLDKPEMEQELDHS